MCVFEVKNAGDSKQLLTSKYGSTEDEHSSHHPKVFGLRNLQLNKDN